MKFLSIVDPHTLTFAQTHSPVINTGECLVTVKAIGINRADLLQKAGHYPPPAGESDILGIEMAGVVQQVFDSESNLNIGDKVYGLVPGGAYAEVVKVQTNHLMKLPEHFSFEQGAAIAEVFLTAYQCLFTIAKLTKGEKVLIHAGASGVGTAAIQLAKHHGCEVTVTVSNQEKANACLALGADHAIIYTEVNFVEWAKQHNPVGFNVIIDVVAGNYVNKNIDVVTLDSRIVILSILGGRFTENVDVAKLLMKRIQLIGSTLRNRSNNYKRDLVNAFINDFGDALTRGSIKPVIDQAYPWQEANAAHEKMATNANIGKLVLTVN